MLARPSNPIVLYDLKSRTTPHDCWSPNVWKARMVLNYKQIPYKTVTLSYHEIGPHLSSLGITLTPGTSNERYALPAIQHPSSNPEDPPKVIMGSYEIAEFLETTYPDSPHVFPPHTAALQHFFLKWFTNHVFAASRPILVPLIPSIVDEESIDYFKKTRKAIYGCEVHELEVDGLARQKVFERLKDAYGTIGSALNHTRGPFLGGDTPVFADMILLGHILWMQKSLPADEWDSVRSWHDGRWEILLKSSESFTQVL